MKKIINLILIMLILFNFAGCKNNVSKTENTVKQTNSTVKIGILPDVDSLPFILARENGYFKNEGVDVELIMFKSAADRDSAFLSNNIDGVVSDMLAAIFAASGGFDVKITSHTDGRYIFLASKQSEAKKVSDLKGKEIGLSLNTIIEYSVDSMLKNSGINPEDVKKTAIPQIPVRLEMLKSGKIQAACLPDPLATLAVKEGAIALDDTSKSGNTLGVMLFSKQSVENKKDEIKKLYKAYEKAKEEINKNGDKYRTLLTEKAEFPEAVKDTIKFPQYKKSYLPQKNDFEQVYNWIKEKKLLKKEVDYTSIITKDFVE